MDNRKRSRTIVFLLLAVFTLSGVGAVSYPTGISLGVRDTSLYDYVVSPALEAEIGDFELGLNFASGKWFDGGAF